LIAKIKKGLKKRKVKLFFVFLLCSFLAWFISNLSESYTSITTFDLNFVGVPEHKMLTSTSKEKLEVQLEAIGFQFFRFNFNHKTVAIDLSKAAQVNERYFIPKNQYQKQIEKQLSSSVRLVQIVDDTIFFDLKDLITKELPVEPVVEITFEQNYVLEGEIYVEPATISAAGPVNELDTILSLKTHTIELYDLSSDFSRTVFIVKPDSLLNSSFSREQVRVSGKVSRFSEKIIKVPVQVLNLPKNMDISTFPEEVEVLCKAEVSRLKNINSADFIVIADYKELLGGKENNTLSLSIQKSPTTIFGANLVQNEVSYILTKK
jgi:YbbR domain-containing protein